jgi:hypothetical protein
MVARWRPREQLGQGISGMHLAQIRAAFLQTYRNMAPFPKLGL